jgi:hypothetical protein
MAEPQPSRSGYVSWSAAGAGSDEPAARFSRLRGVGQRISWIDATLIMLGVLVYDGCALALSTVAANLSKCPGDCGLATRADILREGFWVIPLVTALPVVVAVLLGKRRIAIAVVQLLLCSILLVQQAHSLERTNDRLNGTATCWNAAYSDADCPWGRRD